MAKFQPGHKLAKGRPKGAPNVDKRTVREIIEAALGGKNLFDKVSELIARVELREPDKAAKLYLDMAPYAYPKLALVQVDATVTTEDANSKRIDALIDLLGTVKQDQKRA